MDIQIFKGTDFEWVAREDFYNGVTIPERPHKAKMEIIRLSEGKMFQEEVGARSKVERWDMPGH